MSTFNKALFCLRDFTCTLWYSGVEEKQAIVILIPNYLLFKWKLWSDWLKGRDVNMVLLKEALCTEELCWEVSWAPPLCHFSNALGFDMGPKASVFWMVAFLCSQSCGILQEVWIQLGLLPFQALAVIKSITCNFKCSRVIISH